MQPFVSCHQWPCQAPLPSYTRQLQSQDYQTNVMYQLAERKYASRISNIIPISQTVASVFQRKGIIVKCSEGGPKTVLPHQKRSVNKDSICSGASKFSLRDLSFRRKMAGHWFSFGMGLLSSHTDLGEMILWTKFLVGKRYGIQVLFTSDLK